MVENAGSIPMILCSQHMAATLLPWQDGVPACMRECIWALILCVCLNWLNQITASPHPS